MRNIDKASQTLTVPLPTVLPPVSDSARHGEVTLAQQAKNPRMNSSQSCYGVIIGLSSKENGGGVTVSAIGLKRLTMEKRREERILIMRLARVGRRTGIVRNISTSGAFFETDVEYVQGSEIILAIELGGPAEKKLILRCRGTVMRMEHRDGIVGIGVKIVASQVRVSIQESQLIQ